MKPIFLLAASAAMLGLSVPTMSPPARAESPQLKLDARTQTRLQIRTAAIEAAHSSDSVSGFATVVDATPLLQLISDYDAAKAALAASAAEAERSASLAKDNTMSSKAAETARAQAQADQSRVTLFKQRLGFEWGPYFAGLSDNALHQLARDVSMAQASIVRIDTPSGQGLKGATAATIDMGTIGAIQVRVVGIARTADQRLQSAGVIALASGSQAAYLGNGLTLPAKLYGGGGTNGLLIPNSALLRQGGRVYAYVRTNVQTFDKRSVTYGRVTADGLIVNQNFRAGEQVVIQGASALLAAETPVAAEE
ncbi:MAG: hypothetical protein QM647_08120 [Asticcacaulis sp.]|uniref:hypothetical protein n=1 Tax=Asticcacaulis sp. TaxID=1872648 RepID=UPI0039E29C3C